MLVGVTSLKQDAPDELRPPESEGLGSRLVQQLRPCPALARFLYRRIGGPCGWLRRLTWSDAQWDAWLARRDREFWVSWQHGQLTGFAELWLGEPPERTATYIKYLGLLPEHCGVGLGGHLVADVTRRAWTAHRRVPSLPRVERVSVDTRDWDDLHALPNYLARGFHIERRTQEEVPVGVAARLRTSAGTSPLPTAPVGGTAGKW